MRVLVTGASGFVGRALCPALGAAGHSVLRAVRRDDGQPDTVVSGDLGPSCEWLDRVECPDVIVHLAARVHQMNERHDDAERLHQQANAQGTLDELYTIAAAVIGGTSLAGGVGTIAGAMLGAIVMQSLNSGMVLLGLDTPLQSIVIGIVLVVAVWLDTVYRARAK